MIKDKLETPTSESEVLEVENSIDEVLIVEYVEDQEVLETTKIVEVEKVLEDAKEKYARQKCLQRKLN